MSEKLSDDERGEYERRIIQLKTAIEAIKKRAESAEEDWQLAEKRIERMEDEIEKLREANVHYLAVCKENQNLEDELVETKAEIEKLRAVIEAYKNGDNSN